MELTFNTNIAARYDVNIAIILQLFAKSQSFNTKSSWFEMSPETLDTFLSFWPPKKIKTLVNKLIKINLLERKTNTLCWYALTPLALAFYPSLERKF